MTSLTLVLLVDAFRRDYVHRTSFIRDLAAESRTGAFREDFGFLPHAAYFGGLGPSDAGFTNMYCCAPVASPFGLARGFPASVLGRQVEEPLGIRARLDADARKRVTPYAATYVSSMEIPLALLPWFDVVEKHAPWDRRVGYRSIFHELEDRGWPFFCAVWPETNRLADRSDDGIVRATLAEVRPPCPFAFVHLQQLDAIGHAYGPESREILTAIDRIDALVSTLITTLRTRFDRVNVLLFGDHGMVPVTNTTDVWAAIESTGAVIGRDVVPFLDSTMARLWFPTGAMRAPVIDALAPLPGHVLSDGDIERLDLAGCDPRNGEVIFLADPGVLITPNFFHRRGEQPRGMHGYEPDCPDNQGFFLVHEPGTPRGAVGTVPCASIYSESRRLLGLGAPTLINIELQPADRLAGTFTQHPDKDVHAMLRAHMSRLIHETVKAVPDVETIILAGSFGRDEGSVTRDETGALHPLNDYDITVVAPNATSSTSATLRALGCRLAAEFDIDFVHFGVVPALDPASPPTLANYDLRHGSRVLWGNTDALETLPRYAATEIPLVEALQLVCNRLGGLLSGLRSPEEPAELNPVERRYLLNQTMKALMALGDWHLMRANAYDASYLTRLERFTWLADGLSVPAEEREAILRAYRFKLHPDRVKIQHVTSLATKTQRWLVGAAVNAIGEVSRREVRTVRDAASAYCETWVADDTTVAADNAYAARTLAGDALVTVRPRPAGWVRQAIYASIPLVAAAADGDREAFADAGLRLGACLTPPWPDELTPANWELVRHRLSHAWLTLVH